MTCEAWGEDLSAWMDGELPEQRASQVARHLKGCADCQRALRGFQQLTSIARKQPAPRVSSRVTDPAMALVIERARSRKAVSRWRMLLDGFLPKMTLAVAGAAVAGLLAVIATGEFSPSPYHGSQTTTVASTGGETSSGERPSAQTPKPGISGDLSVADAKDGADRVTALARSLGGDARANSVDGGSTVVVTVPPAQQGAFLAKLSELGTWERMTNTPAGGTTTVGIHILQRP
jgi:anti-sigma factor RsiW